MDWRCVFAYAGSFLPDLGWATLAALATCIIVGLLGLLGTPAVALGLLILCLKAAGIVLATATLIALLDALVTCKT